MFKKLNIIQKIGLYSGLTLIIYSIFELTIRYVDDYSRRYIEWEHYYYGFPILITLTLLWIKILNDNRVKKYYDFIGVENEGHKRLLIISFFITPFLYQLFIEEGHRSSMSYITFIPISIFLNGLIIKIYNWVKDGYKK